MEKFAFIDRARGIAILMVVAVHTSQSVPGLSVPVAALAAYGQMGVQLFFVASAFTLCLSHQRRDGDGLLGFYLRRFFRIAPLYYVGVGLYALLNDVTWFQAVANLLLAHGFIPDANNNVVPGGWSIGTEVAFYAVFPALFAGMLWLFQRYRWGWIVAAIIGFGLLDFVVMGLLRRVGLGLYNNSFAYYNIVNQMPVFLIGIAAFLGFKQGWRPCIWRDAAGFLGFGAGAAWLLQTSVSRGFMLLPAVAAVSFVFLLNVLRWSGESPVLQRIGQLSFSIYVFHFLFAWNASRGLVTYLGEGLPPDVAFVLLYIATMAASAGVAVITERLIERPGIALGAKIRSL